MTIDSDDPHVQKAYDLYKELFNECNGGRADKYPCLMDVATIAVKKLKKEGRLDDLDVSDEINACSICVDAEIDGKTEKYLVMFKNETHNHRRRSSRSAGRRPASAAPSAIRSRQDVRLSGDAHYGQR